MANDQGTDGTPVPPQGVDATAAAVNAGAAMPAFPQFVARPEPGPGGVVPPPLKPDSSFRGIASLASDKRPMLREVKSTRPAAPEPARQPAEEAATQPDRFDEDKDEVQQRPVAEDEPRVAGMRMPSGILRASRGRQIWFALSFVAPIILGAIYLFAIAPDQYITEFRFSVRLPVPESTTPEVQNKSFLFNGNTTPGTDLLDNYTVVDYVTSRQAAMDVNAKLPLREAFSKPSDPLSRLGKNASAERMAWFWQGMVYSTYDPASGLAVVRVKAYSPQDSFAIATNLVSLSSELVNSIGLHSQEDSVRFAQQQVDDASAKLATMNAEMANARRTSGFINPDLGQSGPVNAAQAFVAQLNQRDSQLKGQIAAVSAQLHSADAPQLQLLREQLAANSEQLRVARQVLLGNGNASMAKTVTDIEALTNRLHDYQGVLHAAINTLAATQAAAHAQRVYMTTYVKPTMPEAPLAPQRWLDLLIITLAAAMVWMIGRLIENSILEHG